MAACGHGEAYFPCSGGHKSLAVAAEDGTERGQSPVHIAANMIEIYICVYLHC